jgi:hypothetical protein
MYSFAARRQRSNHTAQACAVPRQRYPSIAGNTSTLRETALILSVRHTTLHRDQPTTYAHTRSLSSETSARQRPRSTTLARASETPAQPTLRPAGTARQPKEFRVERRKRDFGLQYSDFLVSGNRRQALRSVVRRGTWAR